MSARAVILAGGRGTRLAPYTAVLPKPLMPVGDRPILDLVLRQLAHSGFGRVTIAVGHLAHLIWAVLGDGTEQGVEIDYHLETEPLGTAGPLATISDHESLLAMNGDLLTDLDFGAFYAAHKASGNSMSVAVYRRVVKADYGVRQRSPARELSESARVQPAAPAVLTPADNRPSRPAGD